MKTQSVKEIVESFEHKLSIPGEHDLDRIAQVHGHKPGLGGYIHSRILASRKYSEIISKLQISEKGSGLTRYQISKKTGLEQSTIKRILDGTMRPGLDTVIRLADGLGLEIKIK